MKIETTDHGGAVVVAFEGDVDLQTSPDARKALLAALSSGKPLLADLSKVDYIDSSGVASLVEALQSARKSSLQFGLVSVSDSALRVLQLANLDKVFTISDDIDTGLKAVGG